MAGPLSHLWNHADNVWVQWNAGMPGPRTTNHAEGWHSDLKHDFGHPHPALNTFHWLQGFNNSVDIRISQLSHLQLPHPARPRDPRYAQVDRNINDAKFYFADALTHYGDDENILEEVDAYLQNMVHLLGQL